MQRPQQVLGLRDSMQGRWLNMVALWVSCQATSEERRRSLPGDALVAHSVVSVTHAITIDVPPDQVWPWLAQMGCGRAGWYSYDHLDNAGKRSATTINPAWQQVTIGDVLPAAPGMRTAFVVVDVAPGKMLLLGVLPTEQPTGSAQERAPIVTYDYLGSWCLVLDESPAQHTRLIARSRVNRELFAPARARTRFFAPFATPSELLYRIPFPLSVARGVAHLVHYFMEQRMLAGIKWRAETRSGETSPMRTGATAPRRVRHGKPETR